MYYTKIQNALNLIKSVCVEIKDCDKYPLREPEHSRSCYILNRLPQEWEFAGFERNPCIFKK